MKVLDKVKPDDSPKRLPPPNQATARNHVQQLVKSLKVQGERNLRESKVIANIDGTHLHSVHDLSPCVTRSRGMAGGHWIVARGRRFTCRELERLFGFHCSPPCGGSAANIVQPDSVPDRHWGAMLGNTIPVPLIGRALAKALPAAGLTNHAMRDVWATA